MKGKKGRSSIMLELKRQTVHFSGILFALSLIYLGSQRTIMIIGTALFVAIMIAIQRNNSKKVSWPLRTISRVEKSIQRWLGGFERKGELPMGGAITYGTGVLMTIFIFPPQLAVPAILVLAFADAASTVVGRMWGRTKLFMNPDKSWEGSMAFFLTCLAVLMFFVNPMKATGVALIAVVVEALPKIDDNVSIPIAVALLLSF